MVRDPAPAPLWGIFAYPLLVTPPTVPITNAEKTGAVGLRSVRGATVRERFPGRPFLLIYAPEEALPDGRASDGGSSVELRNRLSGVLR